MSVKIDGTGILNGLDNLQNRMRASLGLYSDTASKKLENYAKTNYPWNDQTFQASRRLKCDWEWKGQGTRISLSHGVDYGIWLEVRFGGKNAILKPTINSQSPSVIRGLENLLK